jgi:hypothetical protein
VPARGRVGAPPGVPSPPVLARGRPVPRRGGRRRPRVWPRRSGWRRGGRRRAQAAARPARESKRGRGREETEEEDVAYR